MSVALERPAGRATSPLRRCLVATCVAVLSACADPSIRIEFDLPREYRSQVASVVLRILEPPASEPFSCDDIAFRSVSEDILHASQLQEVTARLGESLGLAEIPRLGDKLFWLEGRDAQNLAIVAGCAAVGDVTGTETITVVGEPTTVASSAPYALGQPLPDTVQLFVNDVNGNPLSGVDVNWTVVGPADVRHPGSTQTMSGRAFIDPDKPEVAGPALIDIHVRWERVALPPVVGFEQPEDLFTTDLPGAENQETGSIRTNALYTVGRVGPQGEMGFVALGPPALGGERQALIAHFDPGEAPFPFSMATTAGIDNALTLGRVAEGPRETVIVATPTAWYEILPDGATVAISSPGRLAKRMVPAGSCTGDSGVMLVSFINDTVAAYDAQGNEVESPFADSPPSSAILGSGCVSGLDEELHRAIVFGTESAVQTVVADMAGTLRSGAWVNFSPTVGFAPALGDQPAALLGIGVDLDGVAIERHQLAPLGSFMLEPQLIADDASLTFARSFLGGDFDGDGRVDIAALLDFGLDGDERNEVRVQLILGTEYRGQRVVGVSQAISADDPQIYAADFDGDGVDDILFAGRTSVSILHGEAPR